MSPARQAVHLRGHRRDDRPACGYHRWGSETITTTASYDAVTCRRSGCRPGTWPPSYDACECGDFRWQHAGPENRGSCRVCRGGKPPPAGADGCQRFRLARLAAAAHHR